MKQQLVNILTNIAKLLEIKGESFFKFSAYSKAADILKSGDYDIETLVKEGRLSEIEGIGKALNEKITDFVTNGKMQYYENLKSELPESLVDLLKIEGLGPKKILQIFTELRVASVDDLYNACISGEIEKVKGFSKQGKEKILGSIEKFRSSPYYKERNIDFDQIL